MRHRLLLLLYLAAVLTITSLHDPVLLAALLPVAFLLAGRDLIDLAWRALAAMLIFNSVISISYAVIAGLRGEFAGGYLILINLRVYLLTFLTFLLARKVNLFSALSFSRTLSTLLSLASSQIQAFRRLFGEFNQALISRSPVRPGPRDLYRHAAVTGSLFLRRALNDMTDISQAMRSRGFFINSD
ncbi:MAG: ABC transporter permease [bacterium]|nr:ABC transporter permease [bacterium]